MISGGISYDRLPSRTQNADKKATQQAYNVPSPNEVVMDTGDYVGVDNDPEKDPIAIINPDNSEQESDQLQDLPLANDCASIYPKPHLTITHLTPLSHPPSPQHHDAHHMPPRCRRIFR